MRSVTKLTTLAKLLLSATALSAATGATAADFYLKLGPVTGELSDSKVREAAARLVTGQPIPIQSYSWGASQGTCCKGGVGAGKAAGSGMGSGKVNVQDLHLKYSAPINVVRGAKPAAADYDGDGRADRITAPRDVATGQSSGKRQYKPLVIRGSVTVAGALPSCTVGATYAYALLHGLDGHHRLDGVAITSCGSASGSGGGQPTNSLTMSYIKRKLN